MFSKLLDLLFFIQSRKCVFHSQGNFPWSNKFSSVKEIFHKKILLDQGHFPQTRNFSTVKESFHKTFTWSRKYSTSKEIFHKIFFPWSGKYSTNTNKEIFHNQKCFGNKNQEGFLKTKILDPFNTKSYEKIFSTN